MSWDPSLHGGAATTAIQTNVPDYNNGIALKERNIDFGPAIPAKSFPSAADFSTPKSNKMKMKVDQEPGGRTALFKQQNVQLLGEKHADGKDDEFATPKASELKPRVKLHKEKLSKASSQPDGSQTHNIGCERSSSSGYSVPTAHVSPSLARHVNTDTTDSGHRAAAQTALPFRYDPDLYSSHPGQHYRNPPHQQVQPITKAWGSQPNLFQHVQKASYEVLPEDLDATLNQSRFIPHTSSTNTADRDFQQAYIQARDVALPHTRGAMVLKESQEYLHHKNHPHLSADFGVYKQNTPLDIGSENFNITRASSNLPSVMSHGLSSTYKDPLPLPSHSATNYGMLYNTPAVYDMPGGTHTIPAAQTDVFGSDLTRWQQRHQEQLRKQKLEATSTLRVSYDTVGPSSVSRLVVGDHKLDSIKQAADNIIKEKDNIIDRQKMKILHLESETRDQENVDAENHSLEEEAGALRMQLQEMQYKNADLKGKLAESSSSADNTRNVEQLENKLGQTEFELEQLQGNLEHSKAGAEAQAEELKKQLSKQEDVTEQWKEKYKDLEKTSQQLQQKLNSMERYFQNVATPDESKQKEGELRTAQDTAARYKQKVCELEKRLSEASKGVKSRDSLIESLESGQQQLTNDVQQLKTDKASLEQELEQLRDTRSAKHQGTDEQDVKDIMAENKQLKAEFARAKKVLGLGHKKQQAQEASHRSTMQQQQERLEQEEAAVTALREEISTKDTHLKKLRASIKELGGQNQDLMEKNVGLGEQLRQLEWQQTGEAGKLQRRLVKEMAVCFTELQSIVQICVERAEGDSPNLSMLLGTKTAAVDMEPASASSDPSGAGVQALKYKVTKVAEMRKEIDKLRELISNKYAEDMGANLNCTTQ